MHRNTRRVTSAIALAMAFFLSAPPASAEGNEQGESQFNLCSQCHGAAGEGNRLFLAPAIAGLPEWYLKKQLYAFRDGLRGNVFEDISGMRMRPMARHLTNNEDLEAVAKYVADLPAANPAPVLEGGNAETGKTLYAPCIACHGLEGQGMEPLGSPPIVMSSDWYLVDQLQKFKDGIRGANAEDPMAMTMRPMSMTLVDDQAMKDVIAYVMSLRK